MALISVPMQTTQLPALFTGMDWKSMEWTDAMELNGFELNGKEMKLTGDMDWKRMSLI